MSTALTIYANTGTQDTEVDSSGASWVEIDVDNDEIIFSKGSDVVADGLAIPSEAQLSSAGMLLDDTEQTVEKYFLADNSTGLLEQIHNAGNQNKRYVFGFSLDGPTTGEPVLELWDDTDLDSIDNICLGAGTASSSWFRGITTTAGLPGADWVGSRLAGSADGYFLNLNNGSGALVGADVLYCQLKVIIPSTQQDAGAETPVIAIKFSTT